MSRGGVGAWTSWALMEAVPVKLAQQAGVTLIRIPTAPAGDTGFSDKISSHHNISSPIKVRSCP